MIWHGDSVLYAISLEESFKPVVMEVSASVAYKSPWDPEATKDISFDKFEHHLSIVSRQCLGFDPLCDIIYRN